MAKKTVTIAKDLTNAEEKAIKDFLKAAKHDAKEVDKLKIDTDTELIAEMLILHGVTPEQYQAGKKKVT